MATKEPKPKILKVVRTDAFVEIHREVSSSTELTTPNPDKPGETTKKTVTNSRNLKEKAHEAPLPAFDTAMQDLAGVAAKILDCPPEWRKTITVVSVSVSYTEHGIRSVSISFAKSISATGKLHPMKTPVVQVDDGKTEDQGRSQLAEKHAQAVKDFLKEAQRYAAGERSQTLLDFEEEDDAPEAAEPDLPGIPEGEEGVAGGKKPRKPRK